MVRRYELNETLNSFKMCVRNEDEQNFCQSECYFA